MDRKELLDKFSLLLTEVEHKGASSDDFRITLSMFRKAMVLLAESDLRSAKELMECYEGAINYNNFLTEMEAESIVGLFINQDGSRGPKWRDHDELFRKVEEMDGHLDCPPYYNKWALYATMNKFASDQHSVIVKWVGDDKDKYFEACYELALTQLKDKDRPCWIRPYYELCE